MDKEMILGRMGCLNKFPEKVENELFRKHHFFDPKDKLQIKYEMLRAVAVDGRSVTDASNEFGYSRETYYTVEREFKLEGTVGLMDTMQGRRQPEKLVDEVVKYIASERHKDPKTNSGKTLAEKVREKFKIQIHKRTIYKVLKKTAVV